MEALRWVGFAAGISLVIATWGSVLRTLVIPRGYTSKLSVFLGRRIVRAFFLALANRFDDYETKDRILALSPPISLLAILVTWLLIFLCGYTLILWPLIGASLGQAFVESGSSMLTLGYAGTQVPAAALVHFLAAGTGLMVVALEIAYLPVLYGAFNRREQLVTLLQSRAGSPAWGPEILARHQIVASVENLKELYRDWEQWAADVAETHTNYPVLVWFRSPHPYRSWVLGLLAVMDSAALYLALCPNSAPSEARMALRMGFTALRDIATALRIPFDPDPFPDDPIELTFDEFEGGIRRLKDLGFPMERTSDEAWPHFRGWRVNYEALVYTLADATVAVPGPWSGTRSHLPDVAIVPQRPANRRPEDPADLGPPKGHQGF